MFDLRGDENPMTELVEIIATPSVSS